MGSRFHWNDKIVHILTFYEIVKIKGFIPDDLIVSISGWGRTEDKITIKEEIGGDKNAPNFCRAVNFDNFVNHN